MCKLVAQSRGIAEGGFKGEVERHLTGRETEPWEIIYLKMYKSHLPVVEKALETAGLMLGTDKSRSYCLEMICADFLAGAKLEDPLSVGLVVRSLSTWMRVRHRQPRLKLEPEEYTVLKKRGSETKTGQLQ